MTTTPTGPSNHGQHVRHKAYLDDRHYLCPKAPYQKQTEEMQKLAKRLGLVEIRSHQWLVEDSGAQRCIYCKARKAKPKVSIKDKGCW